VAIAIIVEDGSNVPDANAYVSVADVRQYATARGITLPADDDAVAAMIVSATDYLESLRCQYQGFPTYAATGGQSLEWPRECVVINVQPFPNDAIPKQLKAAQCAGVVAINEGYTLLQNTNASDYVIEETVGPITTKYADPIKAGVETNFATVDAAIAPLMKNCCGTSPLRTVRV